MPGGKNDHLLTNKKNEILKKIVLYVYNRKRAFHDKQARTTCDGNIAKILDLEKVIRGQTVGPKKGAASTNHPEFLLKNKNTTHKFMRNISECKKVAGWFFATNYDSKTIFEKLKKNHAKNKDVMEDDSIKPNRLTLNKDTWQKMLHFQHYCCQEFQNTNLFKKNSSHRHNYLLIIFI